MAKAAAIETIKIRCVEKTVFLRQRFDGLVGGTQLLLNGVQTELVAQLQKCLTCVNGQQRAEMTLTVAEVLSHALAGTVAAVGLDVAGDLCGFAVGTIGTADGVRMQVVFLCQQRQQRAQMAVQQNRRQLGTGEEAFHQKLEGKGFFETF